MTVTSHAYPKIDENAIKKTVNLSTDSLKVMLFASYTFSASHATMTDVKGAGTESTGTGYTAGGQALSGVTVSTSGTTTTLTCSNPTWASSTITAAYAVFYDAQGGTDATNLPICYWDLGGSQSSSNGSFTLTINGSGLVTWTAS